MNRISMLQDTKDHLPQNNLTQKINFTQIVITHIHHELGQK